MQLDEIRQWRAERTHDVEIKERERLASHVREAVAWFGASEDQDDYCTRYSGACSVVDGHWALEEPSIVSWLEQSRENPVMWLNGKPGAGEPSRIYCIIYVCTDIRYRQKRYML